MADFAAKKILEGKIIFSPIAHSIGLQAGYSAILPSDYKFWRAHCEAMIDLASEFWILKLNGWDKSYGVQEEAKYAKKIGLEIQFKEF